MRWPSLDAQAHAASAATRQLLAEIAQLRRDAERHNNPATYAMSAKYQRQANAKEKELKALQEQAPSASGVASSARLVKVRRGLGPKLN